MPSAACVRTASTVRTSTSLWCASIAWTTSSCSPYLRAISAPMMAWLPSTSWVSALPMSCSTVQHGDDRLGGLLRRHPLDGQRHDLAGAGVALLPRLVLDVADEQRGFALGLRLDRLDQLGLRVGRGQPGHPLELLPPFGFEVSQ